MDHDQFDRQVTWKNAAGQRPHTAGPAASWRRTARMQDAGWFARFIGRHRWMRIVERLVALSLTAAAVCSVLFLLQLIGCRQTHLGVRVETDYDERWSADLPDKQIMRELSPIPDNLFAERDRQALLDLAGADAITASPSDGIKQFLQRCVQAADWGKRDVLAVYVSLYAVETTQGVRVIPRDADPDQPKSFLPLERLTAAVSETIKPLNRPVLLALDVSQFEPNWRMGTLSGLSMKEIKAALTRLTKQVPGLVVMCSCDDYEQSWVSPDLGMSVFTYFLIDALDGERHASSKADTNQDGTVRVSELFEFVRARVNGWVMDNRDPAGQHPILIPSVTQLRERDFALSMFIPRRNAPRSRTEFSDEETQKGAAGTERSAQSPQADRDQKLTRLIGSWKDWDRSQYLLQQDAPLYWRVITHQLLFAQRSWRAKNFSAAERALAHVDVNLRAAAVDVWDVVRNAQDPQFILANVTRRVRRGQPRDPSAPRAAPAIDVESPQDWFAYYKDALPPKLRQSATLDRVRNLRDLAENAAIGSLGTWTAVRQLTTQADGKRRLYEDRLFTGVRTEDREADRVAAQRLYQQALDVQQVVTQSRQLVNRLYCVLPELARWSAFRCRVATGDDPDLQQTVALLEALAEQLGQAAVDPRPTTAGVSAVRVADASFLQIEQSLLMLFDETRGLERISHDVAGGDFGQLDALRALTDRTTRRLENALDDLNGRAEQLAELTEFQWNDYRDLSHLLRCPVFGSEDRERLLKKIDEMSSRLNQQYIKRGKSLENRSPRKLKHTHVVVLRMWRSMWALQTAMLADSQFSTADVEVELWLRRWQKRGGLDPNHKQLLELVERIRLRFVEQKQRLVTQADSPPQPDDLQRRREDLESVDRWARVLHASDAVQCLGRKLRPTLRLRQFQVAELCSGLAERYLDDYWKAFYRPATESCLSVARDVPGFERRFQTLNDRLQVRSQTVIRVPQEQVNFGTEQRKTLRLTPTAESSMPAGRAAIWIAIDGQRLIRRQDQEQARREWAIGGDQPGRGPEFPLERQQIATDDCPITVKADCQVFFRGHTARDYNRIRPLSIQAADLNPCPTIPDRLKYVPPGKFGKAVVLGADRRSLIFVLDCSNSMLDTDDVDRWTPAVKALRRVVANLANRKTAGWPHNVGLMAFGHRLRKLGNSARVTLNPQWEWAKWNLRKPGTEMAADFEMLLRIQPLREGGEVRFDNLLDANREGRSGPLLKPWGFTPVYGAMIEAAKQFGNGKAGTLVVITDGVDTVSPPGALERVPKTLVENHVNLYVVGYLLRDGEKNKYRGLCADSGGEFVEVNRPEQMLSVLSQAVKPRDFVIRDDLGDTVDHDPLGQESARLEPGEYTVSFPQRDPIRVRIQGGERLAFDKDDTRLRLRHRQGTSVNNRLGLMSEGHSLGYKRFAVDLQAAEAVLDVSLFDEQADGIYPGRPEEMRISVVPVGSDQSADTPQSIHFRLKPDCSIPTWTVRVGNWPGRSAARVRAWWKTQRTPPDMRLSCADLPRAVELPLQPRRIPFQVSLESRFDKLRNRNSVVISLVPADRTSDSVTPRVAEFDEHMRNLRLNLVRDGQRQRLEFTREYYRKDEKVFYRFELPTSQAFIADEWDLEITTWFSRKQAAQTLEFEARDPE